MTSALDDDRFPRIIEQIFDEVALDLERGHPRHLLLLGLVNRTWNEWVSARIGRHLYLDETRLTSDDKNYFRLWEWRLDSRYHAGTEERWMASVEAELAELRRAEEAGEQSHIYLNPYCYLRFRGLRSALWPHRQLYDLSGVDDGGASLITRHAQVLTVVKNGAELTPSAHDELLAACPQLNIVRYAQQGPHPSPPPRVFPAVDTIVYLSPPGSVFALRCDPICSAATRRLVFCYQCNLTQPLSDSAEDDRFQPMSPPPGLEEVVFIISDAPERAVDQLMCWAIEVELKVTVVFDDVDVGRDRFEDRVDLAYRTVSVLSAAEYRTRVGEHTFAAYTEWYLTPAEKANAEKLARLDAEEKERQIRYEQDRARWLVDNPSQLAARRPPVG